MEAKGKQDESIIKGLFENGFMGIEIDEQYGGAGANFMSSILAVEEISKVDCSISVMVDIHNTLVNALIKKLGTPEQKQKYLSKLATESVGSFALSEPNAGSDAFAMKTTAKKEGSNFILNGTKCWICEFEF
jgi:short-chain 2-methylacyl-CoA dehydrogenase